jgi:ATP-dependent exoDNAse (exonuclease V) beta subunit
VKDLSKYSPDFQPNLQILANAGSGKTHALVTRIIRLLVLGVPPSRIIALTFTRKAAGEFLSKLLQRLATAALDPNNAMELSHAINTDRSSKEYQDLLRKIVDDLGNLQLTTLDSFFHRIVTAFPQELGLSSAPSILSTHTEELAGKGALRHALRQLTAEEKDLLLQSLLERDEGSAGRSAAKDLNAFRREVHEAFLEHPESEAWGNPQRIWGKEGNPWKSLSSEQLAIYRDHIAEETGSPIFPERVKSSWNQLQSLSRGIPLNVVVKGIMASFNLWKQGTGHFFFQQVSYEVSCDSQHAAAALVEHYIRECTEYRLREARAVHHLLGLYEKEYDAAVRSRGLLTFSDMTCLLQPSTTFLGLGSESLGASSLLRLQLDERLDARFDHWLLDEFQDTSRSQYRVLENLLDETISEAARGGERSFFCVGDIKQAIYGWRKGDSLLFDEIYNRYGQGTSGLLRAQLSQSWRSSPEILKILNAVFGNLAATAPTLPTEVCTRWQQAWTEHQCTPERKQLSGYFSWINCEDQMAIENSVLSLLGKMHHSLKQGMTIALLVRTGREAKEWIEILRFAGIEALSDSNPPVGRDNPLSVAIHSALSLSIHPGDQFALHHLSMEPLRSIFFPGGNPEHELETLISQSLKRQTEGGFSAVMEWLIEILTPLICDDFSKSRAASLRRAARKADASGIVNCDDFLSLLQDYEEHGRSAPYAVQVMTIHKAKGLEYDMVVIPLPKGQESLDALGRGGLDLWKNPQGEPFLMKLPAEEIRNTPGNETLASAARNKKHDAAFEELCVWYVAMSRARTALYFFSQEPKKVSSGKCPNFPQLLAAGLEHLESCHSGSLGDSQWHEKFHPQPLKADTDPLPQSLRIIPRPSALEKIHPSEERVENKWGSQLFLEKNSPALGLEIHTLLESIDWLTESPWNPPSQISEEAHEFMQQCLSHSAIRELFQKPRENVHLWREQPFDLLINHRWVSGRFDRVVIFLDQQGHATKATLIDFKTDQRSPEKLLALYSPQMRSYRQALSKILKLAEEKISCQFVLLRSKDPMVSVE